VPAPAATPIPKLAAWAQWCGTIPTPIPAMFRTWKGGEGEIAIVRLSIKERKSFSLME